MITAEQVKELNKTIEGLNAKSNRDKAKLEVLESNLSKAIEEYKKTYGVDLQGKSAKGTAQRIRKELERVEAEVQKEFDLRQAVVAAIERGDIDEANRLLGVETVEEEPEEEVEEFESEGEEFEGDTKESSEVTEVNEESNEEDEEEEDNGFGFNFDFGDLSDEDDEVTEVVEPAPVEKPKKSGKKSTAPVSTVEDVVEELDGNGEGEEADGFGDFDLGDDDDFGFGDMLSGTKFSI